MNHEIMESLVRLDLPFGQSVGFMIGRTALKLDRLQDGRVSHLVTGSAFGLSKRTVRKKAVAEVIEHASGLLAGYERERFHVAPLKDLKRDGRQVVDPLELQQLSDDSLGTLVDRVGPHDPISWVTGIRIVTGETYCVPTLATFLNWRPQSPEPIFIKPGASGLAAHKDWLNAALHALLEVIERDACMLSWRVQGWPVRRINVCSESSMKEICTGLGLKLEIYKVGDLCYPPTILALIHTGGGHHLTCGSSCCLKPEEAIDHAIGEALSLRWTLSEFPITRLPTTPRTSLEHVAWGYLNGRQVWEWYMDQCQPIDAGDLHRSLGDKPLDYVAGIAENQFECPVLLVDATSKHFCPDWSICRAIVPRAIPRESNGQIPHVSGARMKWAMNLVQESKGDINKRPHPFG